MGIVGADYKYIQAPRPELYHLQDDPGELNNLAVDNPDQAKMLRGQLSKLLSEQIREEKIDNKLKLDSETLKQLESLGYVAGKVEDSYAFDADKLDAKDYIDYHRMSRQFSMAMENRNFDQARQICVKLTELYPNVTNLHYKFGLVALQQGRLEESIRHYEILLEHFPNSAKAHAQIAEVLIRTGRPEQALHHLEKALELNPDDDISRGNLGVALNQLGRHPDAAQQFRELLKHNPENAHTHAGLAAALVGQKLLDQAIDSYKKSLALNNQDGETHLNLSKVLELTNQTAKADEHLKKALDFTKDNPQTQADILDHMALSAAKKGQLDQAIELWQSIIKLQPNRESTHANLAQAFARQNNIPKAQQHWNKLLEINSKNTSAMYNLAMADYRQGNLTAAISRYQALLDIEPKHLEALNNLAWILCTSNDEGIRNLDKAKELAEKGCQLSNNQDPVPLDTLAIIYAATGDFDQAAKIAAQAIELADSSGKSELSQEIKSRLKLYQNAKPYQHTAKPIN